MQYPNEILKIEWNGAYHSEALVPDGWKVIHEGSIIENGRIRIRFKINVQDTEIGKFEFEQDEHNEIVRLGRELDAKTENIKHLTSEILQLEKMNEMNYKEKWARVN